MLQAPDMNIRRQAFIVIRKVSHILPFSCQLLIPWFLDLGLYIVEKIHPLQQSSLLFPSDSSAHELIHVWCWSVWPGCHCVKVMYLEGRGEQPSEPRTIKVTIYWVIHSCILVSKRDWSNSFLIWNTNNRWFKKFYLPIPSLTVCKSSSTTATFQHWYASLKLIIILSFEYFVVTWGALISGLHHGTTMHVLIYMDNVRKKFNRYVLMNKVWLMAQGIGKSLFPIVVFLLSLLLQPSIQKMRLLKESYSHYLW